MGLKSLPLKQRLRRLGKAAKTLSCALAIFLLTAQSSVTPEYAIKAVFLFNFTHFVEWPPSAFENAQSPMVIGVLGDDPFGTYLDETVKGEMVNRRPLIVQRYSRVKQINDCHVLFISNSESERLEDIVDELDGRPILTVSDFPEAAKRGVIIRFVTREKKIRLRINVEAAKLADLTISSKLLGLAEIVEPEKK